MAGLLVCAPLRLEAMALRRSLPRHAVVRTGYGANRSRSAVAAVRAHGAPAVAIAGLAAGVAPGVRPGDVVVATELRGPEGVRRCPSAPLLAAVLHRRGLPVREGPVTTATRLVPSHGYREYARTGTLAVDLESAVLAEGAADRPLAVVRVVVDTAEAPLLRLGIVRRGVVALWRLAAVGAALEEWSAERGTTTESEPCILPEEVSR